MAEGPPTATGLSCSSRAWFARCLAALQECGHAAPGRARCAAAIPYPLLLTHCCRPSPLPGQERERVAPELERAEDAITEAQREVSGGGVGSGSGLGWGGVGWPGRNEGAVLGAKPRRLKAGACMLPPNTPSSPIPCEQVTKLKKRVDQILDRAFANFSKCVGRAAGGRATVSAGLDVAVGSSVGAMQGPAWSNKPCRALCFFLKMQTGVAQYSTVQYYSGLGGTGGLSELEPGGATALVSSPPCGRPSHLPPLLRPPAQAGGGVAHPRIRGDTPLIPLPPPVALV